MTFTEEVRAHLPKGMTLPDPFAQAFDWLEAQGQRAVFTRGDASDFSNHYLSIYPPAQQDADGASFVLFNCSAIPPLHNPPEEVMARIVTLAKIAGDGGTLSLWLDEAGDQQIVVFNHGHPYVLTSDPLVALQFLAMGYPEPATMTDASLTPAEQAEVDWAHPPLLPEAFRGYLLQTHGLTPPARASDLGITIPPETAPDPLRDWLDRVIPEPDPADIPGMTPENPYVISAELRGALGEEGMEIIRASRKYIVEEE